MPYAFHLCLLWHPEEWRELNNAGDKLNHYLVFKHIDGIFKIDVWAFFVPCNMDIIKEAEHDDKLEMLSARLFELFLGWRHTVHTGTRLNIINLKCYHCCACSPIVIIIFIFFLFCILLASITPLTARSFPVLHVSCLLPPYGS